MEFQVSYEGYAEKVRRSFDGQSLMRSFQARLEGVEPGQCCIVAPILPGHCQQHGYAHAGLTFAIGDSAAGYAALSLLPGKSEVLTVEMKINLLAPADGDRLRAVGRVVKPGRRLIVVAAEVFVQKDGVERQVALLQGTMIPVD